MAAEYEVNIKLNAKEIETQLGQIDRKIAGIGKPKGGSSRRKPGIAGLLPSSEELRAAEKGLVQLTAKTKSIQSIQDKFSERRTRALTRSNALNEKELRLSQRLTSEARARLRLLSQSGAKGFDATRPQGRQMAESINALNNAQDKRARLLNKINEMEAKGLNVQKLRKQLGKATTEQSARRFGNAEKEFRILEKTLRLEQSKLRILKEQRKGFAASPVRGTPTMMGSPAQIAASGRQAAEPIGGRANLVGSPAYYEAQQKAIDRLARQGGPSDPVKGHANLIGSPKYFEEQQKAIDRLARQGGARSPLKGSKDLVGSPAYFDHLSQEISRLARQGGARSPIRGNKDLIGSPAYYEHQRKELEKLARMGGPSSPIRGSKSMPGSPLALQQGMNRLGQVGLGAGFPLLFGGGPGAVLGGAAGGLTGSFGAQIALSAAGQQIDQLIGRTVESAESLTSVGTALDFLRERSLFSSKESEQLARKLENQGDLTGIAALVTEELNEALGPGGIQKMQDLAEQTRLAKEQWGQLTTNLELLIAGPLAEFLKIVNATLGVKVAQSQFTRAFETLKEKDPERLKAMLPSFEGAKDPAKAIASNLAFGPNMAGGVFNIQGLSEGALISFTEQMNSIIEGSGTPDGSIPITEEDRRRFKPKAQPKGKAQREADIIRRAQERLQIMQQEGDLAKELKKLDFERAAEIDKINKLETVGLEERQNAVQATNDLFDARKGEAIGKALAKDLQTAIDLKKAQEDVLRPLEDQRRLLQGKLDGNEKEVRLQLEIESIMRSVKGLNEEDVENAVRKNALLQEQIAVVEQLDQVYASIGQSISSSIVNALTAAVDETKSLADIATQTLRQIANILLQFGVQSALSSLGGNDTVGLFTKLFPKKALGGAVGANQPYMVGEKGPELFVPGAQGNIVPNNAMGGSNIVVNVDASGSNVEGSGQQAKALGQAIGAAVQAEIVKQKMPGGLLN